MSDDMLATVIHAPRDVRLERIAVPEPAAGEVLVRVDACGLSGTCLRSYRGDFPGTIYPVIPGLEITGLVEALGPGVTGPEPGRRVAIEPVLVCDRCVACRRGRYNCCARLRLLGVHVPGGMAEAVVVPAARVHPVPADLPPTIAALCEPFSIGMQAVARAGVVEGDSVAILGAGVIGLTILLLARGRGARVLVVEPHAGRRELARELGADLVVADPGEGARQAALDFTAGDGASVAIDATGVPAAIATAIALAAPAGRVGIVGVSDEPVTLSSLEIVRKELDLYGVRNCGGRFGAAVDFVAANRERAARLISRVFALADVEAAFRFADEHALDIPRVVLEVGEAIDTGGSAA